MAGPLSRRIRRKQLDIDKNSFKTRRSNINGCALVIMDPLNRFPLTADFLPDLISDIIDKGYVIDTDLSQMYSQVAVSQPMQTFCFAAKYAPKK
jgi:hypothetical protein